MSLQKLFLTLKGSMTSGNYAHRGVPGKHGGSSPGGGHKRIVSPGSDKKQAISDYKKNKTSTSPSKSSAPGGDINERLSKAKIPTHKELSSHYDLNNACPKIDCSGITTYTGPAYFDINSALRNEDYLGGHEETVSKLDKALDELPRTKEEIKVTRMIDSSSFAQSLTEGSEFTDKGYVSTTINPKGDSSTFGRIKMEIIIPKGSKGAYVEDITQNEGELEFLLPRNSKFKVLKNANNDSIVLEYLGDN